eukprot:m.129700 g.129700  ORF g.129700 m.129700 type:complete len:725 (-) comp16767_c0_seq4:117-2291(-)
MTCVGLCWMCFTRPRHFWQKSKQGRRQPNQSFLLSTSKLPSAMCCRSGGQSTIGRGPFEIPSCHLRRKSRATQIFWRFRLSRKSSSPCQDNTHSIKHARRPKRTTKQICCHSCRRLYRSSFAFLISTITESSPRKRFNAIWNQTARARCARNCTHVPNSSPTCPNYSRLAFNPLAPNQLPSSLQPHVSLQVQRMLQTAKDIEQWVVASVLQGKDAPARAATMEKFLAVSKWLQTHLDFNSLVGFVNAFSHPAVSRLKRTIGALSKEATQQLSYLQHLAASGTKKYHTLLYEGIDQVKQGTKQNCIPALEMVLQEMRLEEEQCRVLLADGSIDFACCQALYEKLHCVQSARKNTYTFKIDRQMQSAISMALQPNYTEEELMDMSFSCEKRMGSRHGLKKGNARERLKVACGGGEGEFSEWMSSWSTAALLGSLAAKGFTVPGLRIKQPDEIAVHCLSLADQIFERFAPGNETLDAKTFATIRAAFPLIGLFQDIADPRRATISHQDLAIYLKEVHTCAAHRVFPHNFQKHTFTRPTSCDHCKKLLWGIARQGYRCQDCKFHCHSRCRAHVTQTCSAFGSPTSSSVSSSETSKQSLVSSSSRTSEGLTPSVPKQKRVRPSAASTWGADSAPQPENRLPVLELRVEQLEIENDNLRQENRTLRARLDELGGLDGMGTRLKRLGGVRNTRRLSAGVVDGELGGSGTTSAQQDPDNDVEPVRGRAGTAL